MQTTSLISQVRWVAAGLAEGKSQADIKKSVQQLARESNWENIVGIIKNILHCFFAPLATGNHFANRVDFDLQHNVQESWVLAHSFFINLHNSLEQHNPHTDSSVEFAFFHDNQEYYVKFQETGASLNLLIKRNADDKEYHFIENYAGVTFASLKNTLDLQLKIVKTGTAESVFTEKDTDDNDFGFDTLKNDDETVDASETNFFSWLINYFSKEKTATLTERDLLDPEILLSNTDLAHALSNLIEKKPPSNHLQLTSLPVDNMELARCFIYNNKTEKNKIALVPYAIKERTFGENHFVLLLVKGNERMIIDPKAGHFLGDTVATSEIKSLKWQGFLDTSNCGPYVYKMIDLILQHQDEFPTLEAVYQFLSIQENPDPIMIRNNMFPRKIE